MADRDPTSTERDDRDTRASLAFYFAFILLAGQFIANLAAGVPFNYLLLSLTGAIILGILFGPGTMIDFFRAIRGDTRDSERGPDHDG